ncbi:hypothetical protein GMSM_30380 [Geomonas sp. Red276]
MQTTEQIVGRWRRCIITAYGPGYLYEQSVHQAGHTYPKRIPVLASRARPLHGHKEKVVYKGTREKAPY